MIDISASVLARLKNEAVKNKRSYQVCLQLFCQEEFLRRLQNKNDTLIMYKNDQIRMHKN